MSMYAAVTQVGKRAIEAIAANPAEVLLASDYDGTLAPIVDDPERALPLPAAISALAELGPALGKVVVITGREVRAAVKLGGFEGQPGLAKMTLFGQYGVERWDAATGEYFIPPVPAEISHVHHELPEVLARAGHPKVRLEHKRRAIVVHTREQPRPDLVLEELRQPVTELAVKYGLDVEPGRFVLEIRSGHFDKGRALQSIAQECGARVVVYCGDDLGDIPAFETLETLRRQGMAGVGVCSASEEQPALAELADIVATGPEGIAAWLAALSNVIHSRVS